MGHNLESWIALDEILLELRKKGVNVPENIVGDLRAAKSMLELSCMQGSGDAVMKAEEYMTNVEVYLINEGEKALGSARVEEWLRRLKTAGVCGEVCSKPAQKKDKFVTGVPRDQKWVRVEPTDKLSTDRIQQMAKEQNLLFNLQKDGRLVVYGTTENLRALVKQMTNETKK